MKWNADTAALLPLFALCAGSPAYAAQRAPALRYEAEFPGTGYAPPQAQNRDEDGFAPPASEGPSGSSRPRAGEFRYDETGYAGVRSVEGEGAGDAASVARHRSLPGGTVLEVTSLDTGRTILVLVTGPLPPGADHPLDLSAGAAAQLGYAHGQRIPVRLRAVTPSGPDMAALRSGTAPSPRADAPRVLLTALRKRLPEVSPAPPLRAAAAPIRTPPATPQRRMASTPVSKPAAAPGRYVVQVAALSSAGNAQALARSMGGFVKQGGGLHRVQLGPFATRTQAEAARGRAARAGHPDARVIAN
ncbi:SPOR domain-containing protein [Sphingomonas xinjiangensis]|uniref:Rare lipoprotein A n=1 Tax=Sphingomonas xinjiangensis TaxID=643568 RepID=A0A840YJR8_9SPHN|nr:SPOR domain-containing protein [Sphingomonas xinjiangensis]MBB5709196.1 rare lipoprotein A [Sphingomonas xinjiangensis]